MLIQKLNGLLADYEVMMHKLQTYHWYTKGQTFFTDHAQLEAYYDEAALAVDGIAEKILMIGGKPLASCKEFLAESEVKEAEGKEYSNMEVFGSVREDFVLMLQRVVEARTMSEEDENFLISAFLDDLIAQLSKNIWMLDQVLS